MAQNILGHSWTSLSCPTRRFYDQYKTLQAHLQALINLMQSGQGIWSARVEWSRIVCRDIFASADERLAAVHLRLAQYFGGCPVNFPDFPKYK